MHLLEKLLSLFMPDPEKLYETLHRRNRPEDIAELVSQLLENKLDKHEQKLLDKAAKGSLKKNLYYYTSMAQDFARAVGAEKQIKKVIEIFKIEQQECKKPEEIEAFIKSVSAIIHKPAWQNNFKEHRLNKEQRQNIGLDISKRNYNKKWRLLKRLEKKLQTYTREIRKVEFQMISKHGLAHHISYDVFVKDLDAACFIAYYNARCNVRSVFTNTSQERPFDEICEMLFNRCKTNWWAIAHIYPNTNVLSHLTDVQKGELLGRWTAILQDIASLLEEIWHSSEINRETMIVKKGNDSTTWNNTAGAWNKARDNWMNLTYALGAEYILDEICFGKVLRLMAADVAYWHRSAGGGLDPNTTVWNKIPLPWEVFLGKQTCNKDMIVQYCAEAGMDPQKSGWIAPRIHGVAEFKPTPELVHGVQVFNPYLATILKRHKYFSGKNNITPIIPENN